MRIGFIPGTHGEEERNDGVEDELHTLRAKWDARHLAEALETDQMLKDSHEDLFEQVRLYADQLENLDADVHNAAEELAKIAVSLGYAETARERLEALVIEAHRLKLAVAEAKRQRAEGKKVVPTLDHMTPYILGLLGAAFGLLWGLVAEGVWIFGQ